MIELIHQAVEARTLRFLLSKWEADILVYLQNGRQIVLGSLRVGQEAPEKLGHLRLLGGGSLHAPSHNSACNLYHATMEH